MVALPVWEWFWKLDSRRQTNGFACLSITESEIAASAQLRGISPDDWWLSALDAMEAVRLPFLNKRKPQDEIPEEEISERPVSPVLFDAMFGQR